MEPYILIQKYGRDESSDRHFIGIWIANKCAKKFIDYGVYLQILDVLEKSQFQRYQHVICIDVINLPVSKLYFDIDCKFCKLYDSCRTVNLTARMEALEKLLEIVGQLLGLPVTKNHLTVAAKSTNGCGLHVTLDICVDFVARHLINNRLAGYQLGTEKQLICDNPSNVLLPGGRGYDSLVNLRTHSLYPLTLDDAIKRASVIVTSEQLRNCDHVSVRIQNSPSSNGFIEWVHRDIEEEDEYNTSPLLTSGGKVYVADDDYEDPTNTALIMSRIVLWERIKTFANLSDVSTNIVALKYNQSFIEIKWFNHSTLIISKSIVSQYHIRETNTYPCTRMGQIQLAHIPPTENDPSLMDECDDQTYELEFNESSTFLEKFLNWQYESDSMTTISEVETKNQDRSINVDEWRSRYPYTIDEIAWMDKYQIGKGRNIKLNTKKYQQLFKYIEVFLDWWQTNGVQLAETSARLVDILTSDQKDPKPPGRKRKGKKIPETPIEKASSSSNTTENHTRTQPPTMQELFNRALHQVCVTSTVSFIIRTTRCSVEDACLIIMLMCIDIIRHRPDVQFILVRIATIDKQLTNYLLNAYRGCDWFYLYISEKTSLPALAILNRTLEWDGDLLIKSIQMRNLLCVYILNCSKAGDKVLLFDGNRMNFLTHKELKEVAIPLAKMVDCECAYSYRCNNGIYNPYTRIMEAQGPSLVEVVWRAFAIPHQFIGPSLAIHELAINYFMKMPSFIEYLQATTLYHTLVAPLWPVYDTYPSTHEYYPRSNHEIDSFAVTSFQTLLEDLTTVIQKHSKYPGIFPQHFLQHLSELPHLRRLILTMISIIYTLNTRFNIAYETPSMLISKLFGTDYWQCIGTQFRCTWNQKDNTVSKEIRIDPLEESSTSETTTTEFTVSEMHDLNNVGDSSQPVDDSCDIALIRRLLNSEASRREILASVSTCLNTHDTEQEEDIALEDLITPICERPLSKNRHQRHVESVSETLECFKQINVAPLLRHDDVSSEEFLNRIDVTYKDVNLYALLITSWFIRMGDDHRLCTTAVFKYINEHRKILYNELCTLAQKLVPHGKLECTTSDSLVEVFEKFNNSTEMITPPIYNNVFDIDTIIGYYEPNLTHNERQTVKSRLIDSVPDDIRNMLISALMELLRSSNYNFDLFMEFNKLIGYCEYLGNPLRIGINMYGSSGSGKTSLLTILAKTFNTTLPSNLTSKQFKESITGDNDPNARTIGMNFICYMNEENVVLVSRFKSYIDVGFLVTRDCHATEVIEFPIRAKVVFCTNEPVQVENATDDGFHQRYYPIPLTYAFKDHEPGLDRLIRHRVENPVPSLYLGGQLLMNLHTSGRTVNFAEKLELLSLHLLSIFFFNTLTHPIPKIQTCHVRDDYIKYFSRTNPLKLFAKHAHIEYHHIPISEARLQEILETWWDNNKTRIEHKFTANSSFSKWLNKIDYFAKYRRNDQYFMRIYFNRVFTN